MQAARLRALIRSIILGILKLFCDFATSLSHRTPRLNHAASCRSDETKALWATCTAPPNSIHFSY